MADQRFALLGRDITWGSVVNCHCAKGIFIFFQVQYAEPSIANARRIWVGQLDILNTSFETFERNIREQLARILGPGGFDPAKDITAITVNRWPHGYAYEYTKVSASRKL